MKKKSNIAICVVIIIALAACIFLLLGKNKEQSEGNASESAIAIGETEDSQEGKKSDSKAEADTTADTETNPEAKTSANADSNAATNNGSNTQQSADSNGKSASGTNSEAGANEDDLENTVFENWEAAAVVTAMSIEYPDFTDEVFYKDSVTSLGDKADSHGIYITFSSGDQSYCVYAGPLDAERTDAGTIDVYSSVTGYLTFDLVDEKQIPASFIAYEPKDINTLIAQLTQVMTCEH